MFVFLSFCVHSCYSMFVANSCCCSWSHPYCYWYCPLLPFRHVIALPFRQLLPSPPQWKSQQRHKPMISFKSFNLYIYVYILYVHTVYIYIITYIYYNTYIYIYYNIYIYIYNYICKFNLVAPWHSARSKLSSGAVGTSRALVPRMFEFQVWRANL